MATHREFLVAADTLLAVGWVQGRGLATSLPRDKQRPGPCQGARAGA
jgi:hypothetical protein